MQPERRATATGLTLVFLAVGILVFSVSLTFASAIPRDLRLGSQLLMLVFLLVIALVFRASKRLRRYWTVAFVHFVAFSAILLSEYTGDWALILSDRGLETVTGFAALKLGEDVAIIAVIIALALLSRDKLRELYVARGRMKLGLTVGICSFLALTVLGLFVMPAQGIPPARLTGFLPAFFLIVLADGFMEELLFRGLFLKKFGRFVGDNLANVVTATVFTFVHLHVEFTSSLPVFLVIVFLLGLFWGWLMQRTGSILAPALFHAGADMLVIGNLIATFGVEG